MKAFLKNSAIVLLLAGVALVSAAATSAKSGAGLRGGYWDTSGQWHRWDTAHDTRKDRNDHDGNDRGRDRATGTVSGGGQARRSSSDIGGIAYAYRDGFWDRMHRWHRWNSDEEHRNYRDLKAANYRGWNHDRDGGDGWRRD